MIEGFLFQFSHEEDVDQVSIAANGSGSALVRVSQHSSEVAAMSSPNRNSGYIAKPTWSDK